LELLPPSVASADHLRLLGDILAVGPADRSQAELRLQAVAPGFSWQQLADLASSQGLIYPLVWALKRRSLLLPLPRRAHQPEFASHPTAVLLAAYDAHLERQRRRRDQLGAIVNAFNSVGVEPLLLKGSRYLLLDTGSWCEARDMRDLDILCRRDEAAKAAKALERIGYRSGEISFPTDHHLPLMWLEQAPSAVEVHTEALSFEAREILPTETVWQHAARRTNEYGAFLALPDPWQLLVGLLHHQVSDRGYPRRVLALKALWEFASIGQDMPAHAWQTVADHMALHGQGDVLGSFVAQASRLFALHTPPGIVVSPAAKAHAESTYRRIFWPYPLRRSLFLTDQLRFSFARETLAARYGTDPSGIGRIRRHLSFLARSHRGGMMRRLTGRDDSIS
jgi:hypothetical protein